MSPRVNRSSTPRSRSLLDEMNGSRSIRPPRSWSFGSDGEPRLLDDELVCVRGIPRGTAPMQRFPLHVTGGNPTEMVVLPR
jgi:hypothetical protein